MPDAKDIFHYRNQPYGQWKAGNPIVKYGCVLIIFFGAIFKSPSMILEGSTLCFILLYMPSFQNSLIVNILLNFGIGGFIVHLVGNFVKYSYTIDTHIDIPKVMTLDLLIIFSYSFLILTLLQISKAVTSRDLNWLVDLFPKKQRTKIGPYILAYTYGLFRAPEIISNLGYTIRSRGGCFLIGRKRCKSSEAIIDLMGIWILNLWRFINDISSTIEYIINSRLKLRSRLNPAKWAWSPTDFSILGIQFIVIIGPRLLNLFKIRIF